MLEETTISVIQDENLKKYSNLNSKSNLNELITDNNVNDNQLNEITNRNINRNKSKRKNEEDLEKVPKEFIEDLNLKQSLNKIAIFQEKKDEIEVIPFSFD